MPFEIVLIEKESDILTLTLKKIGSFVNFSKFFWKYWKRPAGLKFCIISTYNYFLSLDVYEDNSADWTFPFCAADTGFEKSCLPLLPLANKKPRHHLLFCWLLGKGSNRKGWLTGLANWIILLSFLCKPVNIWKSHLEYAICRNVTIQSYS